MQDDPLIHHTAMAVIISYAIQWMKTSKSPMFGWISENSASLSRILSVLAAFVSSVGVEMIITGTWDTGYKFSGSIPSVPTLIDTMMHTTGQLGIQQIVYALLLKPPKPVMSLNTATGDVSVSQEIEKK